jgi:hypothetical protein
MLGQALEGGHEFAIQLGMRTKFASCGRLLRGDAREAGQAVRIYGGKANSTALRNHTRNRWGVLGPERDANPRMP